MSLLKSLGGEGLSAFLSLPIEEACRLKFEQGRSEYRNPDEPFVGDPLAELHDECLDALCYANEAERQGVDVDLLREDLLNVLVRTRVLMTEVSP